MRTLTLSAVAVITLAGCTPSPVQQSPVEQSSPAPTVTVTVTPTASPSPTPTASPRPSPSGPAPATVKSIQKPTGTVSCEDTVSPDSGDPIILLNWRVKDPDKVGWTAKISTPKGGDTLTGRGNDSGEKRYLNDPIIENPKCTISVKATPKKK